MVAVPHRYDIRRAVIPRERCRVVYVVPRDGFVPVFDDGDKPVYSYRFQFPADAGLNDFVPGRIGLYEVGRFVLWGVTSRYVVLFHIPHNGRP